MVSNGLKFCVLLIVVISLQNAEAWRTFWKGRRSGGNLGAPHANVTRAELPPDQWFDQKLDHFTESNNELWKQVIAQFANLSIFM